MPFSAGEQFKFVERINEHWWKMEAADGSVGLVPANYLVALEYVSAVGIANSAKNIWWWNFYLPCLTCSWGIAAKACKLVCHEHTFIQISIIQTSPVNHHPFKII